MEADNRRQTPISRYFVCGSCVEPGLTGEIQRATNASYVPGDSRCSEEIEAKLQYRVTQGKAESPVRDWL